MLDDELEDEIGMVTTEKLLNTIRYLKRFLVIVQQNSKLVFIF